VKVAAIQMVSGPRLADNLRDAQALLAEAARAGAELAVLPEYFCLMGQRDTDKLALAEPLGEGPIQRWLADTARALGLWLVGGTLPLAPDGAPPPLTHCRNTTLVYSPAGQRVALYDKIHLFQFDDGTRRYDEAAVLVPGRQPVRFELPSRDGHRWRVGLSICYDPSCTASTPPPAPTCCWCPAPSPTSPARRTGSCCCAPAPSKTCAAWSPPRRAARTRTAAAPGATAW